MNTLSGIPPHRHDRRFVFVLRLWARGKDEPVWVGEIQDVFTGETVHAQSLQDIYVWLKQKTTLAPGSTEEQEIHTVEDQDNK